MTTSLQSTSSFLVPLALVSLINVAMAAEPSIRAMEGYLLKGDGRSALEIAMQAMAQGSPSPEMEYATCVKNRLTTDPELNTTLEPFVAELVLLYQRYWYESSLNSRDESERESTLLNGIQTLLAVKRGGSFDSTERELSRQLSKRGYFVLTGTTPPFRELMIWKQQTVKVFQVVLPERNQSAKVYLLDEFKSFGWAAWSTCDRRATGGWATDKALYAPLPRYKSGTTGSDFQAVFLAHEAQHLADKRRFKPLQPWELEYRAKLTELWAADDALMADRLARFYESQSEDPALAHPYANKVVLTNLRSYLSIAPTDARPEEVRRTSKVLLEADSRRRQPNE
jgi:hypothetical protein